MLDDAVACGAGGRRSRPGEEIENSAVEGARGAGVLPPMVDEGPEKLGRAVKAIVASAGRTILLVMQGRVHQPASNVGRCITFADATSARVYRETVVNAPPASAPTLLVMGFRLRRVRSPLAHALFRLESELNTVLFAGFPGFISKLWLRHDQGGLYRGVYEWDGPERATSYARALYWALVLISEPESIHYAVVPGVTPDDVLSKAEPIEAFSPPSLPRGDWWRPVAGGTPRR